MRLRHMFLSGILTTALIALAVSISLASSHAEAPGTAKDRLADDTDLWAWVTPDAPDAVTIVGAWVPLLEPNGGPNFYTFDDEVHYYINIDNVGDAEDHIRYEFTFRTTRANPNTFLYNTGVVTSFDDPDLNVRQLWSLKLEKNGVETELATDKPVAPNYVGPKSMPKYESLAKSTITTLPNGIKVFVGPRDDPFFVDLAAIFDLLTIRKVPGNRGRGVDGVGGYDVMVIAMQIPKTLLTNDGQAPGANNSVIGIYDSAERLATRTINADGSISLSGDQMQVSRLGQPLINEVIIPLKDKDKFNRTKPPGDGAAFLDYVVHPELPKLFNLLYGIPVPTEPRTDLVTVFLTGIPGLNKPNNPAQVACEMLRLNMSVPPAHGKHASRFGVLGGDIAGFPNGRRLTDDVVDIEERAAAGGYVLTPNFNHSPANQLGDGVDVNDRPFLPYFPYAATPHNPFSHSHHATHREHDKDNDKDVIDDDLAFEVEDLGSTDTEELTADAEPELNLVGANPSNKAQLQYTIGRAARVALRVYDLQGRTVRNILDQDAAAGTFRATWDGRNDEGSFAGKGVFFARLTVNGKVVNTKKLTLR